MKAVNLHFLTRIRDHERLSLFYQALSGRSTYKEISPHEAASLCSFTDRVTGYFLQETPEDTARCLALLDGFFFSYIIEHIGKEFDLLKISSNGEYVLNIELKSEDIGEERIKKQLEQNRYYLSHAARTIYSFTYVMETDVFYHLNDRGHLGKCPVSDLAKVLEKPALSDFLVDGINRFFRASDYLISPVAAPEKFLQGQYFLTNQQFDFRNRILEHLQNTPSPVVGVSGAAGTGKTLLLFDLAFLLSRKKTVLFLHSGPLRKGHLLIDERLKNVEIRSAYRSFSSGGLSGFSYLLIDEADHLPVQALVNFLEEARRAEVPVILTFDPRPLLHNPSYIFPEDDSLSDEITERIQSSCTLLLTFSGNIRINRPVYSFLRTLLCLRDHAGMPDYSCIDVLYAPTREEAAAVSAYYRAAGYEQIGADGKPVPSDTVIAREFTNVLVILGENYYYDDSRHLRAKTDEENAIRILYEGLSHTREHLCILVAENRELFSDILDIKLHRLS